MKNKRNFLLPDFQLFAENGAEDGTKTENTGDETGNDADCEKNENDSFESLINGKYKEDFSKRTQEIIDKRFKKTKELESFYEKTSPIIEKLSSSLGLNADDYDGILSSFNEENGEEYEAENDIAEDGTESDFEEIKENIHKIALGFIEESETLKEIYPDFDLKNELSENELFGKLIKNGVSVKDAFETVHKDELISGAMAYTANVVKEQVLRGMDVKSKRPLENGVNDSVGSVTKINVNALTENEILKILKQVENGADIRF